MSSLTIIDAHVHTYPTAAIGEQALQGAGRSGCSGTIPELLKVMAKGGIIQAVQANMTPTYDMQQAALKRLPASLSPEERETASKKIDEEIIGRMQRRNLWTCQVARENSSLISLISVDLLQSREEMIAEIEKMAKEHGARGLKLHPVANRFYPQDRRLWPAYAQAEKMNLPILFHAGTADIAGYKEFDFSRPINFAEVAKEFPKLKIILAHLGKSFFTESLEVAQKFGNIYLDTSAVITGLESDKKFFNDEEIVEFIRAIGVSRVLFGSDWPWFDPLPAIEKIQKLPFNDKEKQMILGENAARVFNI
ncbi:MAG: amidohydrolase family protein [bacterium]